MEINLAPKIINRWRKKIQARYLLNIILLWGGIGLGMLLSGLAVANFLISRNNRTMDNQIKSLEKQIQAQSKIESQQVYLASKLQSFSGLLATHERHQAIAETIFSLIPTGTTLKGFQIEESGKINLSGSVPDWTLLSQLLINLKQPTEPLRLAAAEVKQVSFSAGGGINFEMLLTLDL